jgi:hypothetical protein
MSKPALKSIMPRQKEEFYQTNNFIAIFTRIMGGMGLILR